MLEKHGVKFVAVACGKFRRYFAWANFSDMTKVPVGIMQARKALKKFRPDVVFSKGGFVSFPVVVAAWSLRVPVIVHESDVHPGLANRMAFKFASKICLSFEETKKYLQSYIKRVVVTGNPVRMSVQKGNAEEGFKFAGLENDKRPVVLVMGGSQGAQQINELVRNSLNELLKRFQVVHLAGRGNLDISVHKKGYVQFEYLDEQMSNIYAMSEIVVSRGGANSLSELAALRKKVLIIPLGTEGSRGDQILNAEIFAKHLGWTVMTGKISSEHFVAAVDLLKLAKVKGGEWFQNGTSVIADLILKTAK